MDDLHVRIFERLADLRKTSDSELKRVEEALGEARAYAETVADAVRVPLVLLDGDHRVVTANRHFYEKFSFSPEESEDILLYELAGRGWDMPGLRELLEVRLPGEGQVFDFEMEEDFPPVGRRKMLASAHQIHQRSNGSPYILLALDDVTERQMLEAERQEAKEMGRRLEESMGKLKKMSEQLETETAKRLEAEEAMRSLEELIENVVQGVRSMLVAVGRDFSLGSAARKDEEKA